MDLKKICLGCMKEKIQAEGKCPYCGFDAQTYEYNARWLPLEHILDGKYLLGRVIGEGGFGITYIGWDLNMEVRVAIKEYFPVGLASREVKGSSHYTISSLTGERKQSYRHGLEKFAAEAKSLARFYHLEGIVAVKDFFFENETAYMVMEYVDGVTLKEYLKKKGDRLDAAETLKIFQPVIRSLEIVHQENIIHRDISPDNIMITKSGESKLIDFGAARMSCTDQNHTFTIILKHGYAPPEQYQTKGRQGPWTDVYAVCATIYRTITGTLPPNAMDRLNRDELKSFEELGCAVPEKLTASVIKKGMALQTQGRFQSMADLYDALYPRQATNTYGTTPISNKKNTLLIAGICAAAVAGAAVILLLAGAGGQKRTVPDASHQATEQKAEDTELFTEPVHMETESETEASKTSETEPVVTAEETEAAGYWYYISSTYEPGIAVRKEPTQESALLCRIPYGTTFLVTEYDKNWGHTTVNGVTGWIDTNYASIVEDTDADGALADDSDQSGWFVINSTYAKGIAVRSKPSKNSALLCRIPYGTEFYVEKFRGNWGYTTVNGVTGWIDTNYAEEEPDGIINLE